MTLTGRMSAEIFFSASFSLPREKLPYPAILFDWKTWPGSRYQFRALPNPRPGRPQETCSGPEGPITHGTARELARGLRRHRGRCFKRA